MFWEQQICYHIKSIWKKMLLFFLIVFNLEYFIPMSGQFGRLKVVAFNHVCCTTKYGDVFEAG